MESEQDEESTGVPETFFDPATGEIYGIGGLLAKLAEAEADISAGRVSSVDLQQELDAHRPA